MRTIISFILLIYTVKYNVLSIWCSTNVDNILKKPVSLNENEVCLLCLLPEIVLSVHVYLLLCFIYLKCSNLCNKKICRIHVQKPKCLNISTCFNFLCTAAINSTISKGVFSFDTAEPKGDQVFQFSQPDFLVLHTIIGWDKITLFFPPWGTWGRRKHDLFPCTDNRLDPELGTQLHKRTAHIQSLCERYSVQRLMHSDK